LQQMGIQFIVGAYKTDDLSLSGLTKDDIVIIPAFGSNTTIYEELTRIGCTVVDTTCGEVLSVWKRIQKYNSADFTTLIFGKYAHEETIATASRTKKYLVLKNLVEAQMIADFIRLPSTTAAYKISEYFQKACSFDFNPEIDLHQVGMASQTTMYAREFIEVSDLIRDAYSSRFGVENVSDHFLELDTICSATQERQDAIQFLLPHVDVMVVVGGYNSSNTISLTRIASEQVPTYHVDGSGKITHQGILYQPVGSKCETMEANWLPKKDHVKIGITSGASTVDIVLEQVVKEILSLDKEKTEL
jgi:4-hydroxy-3-methylbut-2-enyl diphosphate reductase